MIKLKTHFENGRNVTAYFMLRMTEARALTQVKMRYYVKSIPEVK